MTGRSSSGIAEKHPIFGALVYNCEKRPLWSALYRANGGFLGILTVIGLITPFLGMYISVALFWLIRGTTLPKNDLTSLRPFLLPSALILLIFYIFLFWRNYVFAKRVSMTLYSKGLVLGTAKGLVTAPYHKLSAVYFGSRDQGMNLLMKMPSAHTVWVKDQLKSRITFEIRDARAVAFVYLDRYFTTESILIFLAKLEHHTKTADGITAEFIS